ncbi:hypothetical protein L7F22_040350 [Adiantum nelumboides]|nr:hypothetical protein [Adiantum nelumboides]
MLRMFHSTGDAKLWWKPHCRDNPTSSPSWEKMKQALKEGYLPPAHQALKMNEFYALQQLGLTLKEFYSKFVSLRRNRCPQRENSRIIVRASPQPPQANQRNNQRGGRNGGRGRGRGGGKGLRAFAAVGEPTLIDEEEERATLFAAIDNPRAW